MSHDFIRPTGLVALQDTGTGDRYVPVSAMLNWVRENRQPGITERELIRRMESIGVEWTRRSAVSPDNPANSITVDLFRVPADFAARWAGEGPA